MYCELFRLEDEVIATGIDDIDNNLIGEEYDGLTDDGINTIQGPTQTLTLVGSGVTATATAAIFDGGVRAFTITNRGGGYSVVPTVGVTSAPSGGTTAVGIATMIGGINVCNLNSNASLKSVQAVNVVNSGAGYTVAPTITIANPDLDSVGDFTFNEVVTGSISGTTARVKRWDSTTNELEIYNVAGDFTVGEDIVGSTSGATHQLRVISTDPADDGFADNITIETEADSILDFSEQNPFGIP